MHGWPEKDRYTLNLNGLTARIFVTAYTFKDSSIDDKAEIEALITKAKYNNVYTLLKQEVKDISLQDLHSCLTLMQSYLESCVQLLSLKGPSSETRNPFLHVVGSSSIDDVLQYIEQIKYDRRLLSIYIVGHEGKPYVVAIYAGESDPSKSYAVVGNGVVSERREITLSSEQQLNIIINTISRSGYKAAIIDGGIRSYGGDFQIKQVTEMPPKQ